MPGVGVEPSTSEYFLRVKSNLALSLPKPEGFLSAMILFSSSPNGLFVETLAGCVDAYCHEYCPEETSE
jgi:hypothetical protein